METLRLMREDLQRQQQIEEQAQKSTDAAVDAKKSTSIWMKIVNEVKHFYHGFRLLILETRLSAKYVWRMSRGGSLTRRERQQLVRTMSDLFRLVPFSIFVIVPFMEFLLPFFIKFFPNMLPSTFQEPSREVYIASI
jgi:LETM1 and EF-hand domain-containing protein 1